MFEICSGGDHKGQDPHGVIPAVPQGIRHHRPHPRSLGRLAEDAVELPPRKKLGAGRRIGLVAVPHGTLPLPRRDGPLDRRGQRTGVIGGKVQSAAIEIVRIIGDALGTGMLPSMVCVRSRSAVVRPK